MKILSLDVSASSTGWAFISFKGNKPILEFGNIKTSSKCSRPTRLASYRSELIDLLLSLKPSSIVMEDVYSGLNPKTLILLSKFAGVTEECCLSLAGVEPFIIHTNTVKAYFKTKTKEDLFYFIVDILGRKDFIFKNHNDITDAIAQLLCYCECIIKDYCFRCEKEYGYLYEV